MNTLMHYLESIHPLSDGLKAYLAENLRQRRINKDEYLLKAGRTCRHVCFIHTGLLRCFYVKGDKEVSSLYMREGDVVFSIENFIKQIPSYESIQALGDTFVSYVRYEELLYIYRQFPEFNLIIRGFTLQYHRLLAQQTYSIRIGTSREGPMAN